jgi:hypothetical protein
VARCGARGWARDEKRWWYLVVGGLEEVGTAKGIGQGGARLVRTPAARTPGQVGSPLIDVHLTCTRQNEDFVKSRKSQEEEHTNLKRGC